MKWQALPKGDLVAQRGHRYRATVSLETGITKAKVLSYLQGHGWGDVQIYDTVTADTFPGDWGDTAVATADTSRRLLRGEATRLDGDTTIAESPSFPASLVVSYDLLYAYEQVADAPGTVAPVVPTAGGSGARKVWAFFGGLVALGAIGGAGYYYTTRRRRRR